MRTVIASVFGPVVNALVAFGLFALMLVVIRSRRPHLWRRAADRVAREPSVLLAVEEAESQVCGDTTTGR